jgi:multicopper oxidase
MRTKRISRILLAFPAAFLLGCNGNEGGATPSAVAVDLVMDADNPGTWMLHCHVEHHASEMMAVYSIAEESASVTAGGSHAGY